MMCSMDENIVYEAAVRSMFVGWKTKIQGRTTKCSDRFHINLECRNTCDKSRVTIPLHISVRFQEGSIVRNTRNGINESDWGHEERDGGMPIIKKESFTIDLECKEEAFSISINGCHFSDYKHRLPFHTINYMTVTSDVEVCDVSFSGTPQLGCDDSNEKIVYEAVVRSMFVGWKTKVQGRTTKCSDRFHINLECRNTWDKLRVTIPLHIGVRFREGSIVRNTRNGINESDWGHEERDGGMPIIQGESFTIDLECKKEAFSISINGCHFSDYKHRLPFHTINYMTVTSDVEVCDVSFSGIPQPGCDDSNEKIVYEAAVRSMFVGWKTKVQGRTTKCSDRFHINLECSKTWDKLRVTIPLHIGVRFREGSIVRNTRNGINESDWGHEERDGGMPIIKGESFTIDLECKEEAFSISINGCHFSDYKHRLPFHTINYMTVTSDVEVCDVSFSGTPQLGCDDSNEKIVYEAAVRSMFVGWKTKVQGRTTKRSDRFHINLECRNTWDKLRVTIPLHIGVRFREGSIVRNTRNGINESDWGHEERDGGMPIIKGESFTIDLECKEEAFSISINGCHFSDYKHRLPFHTINYMTVTSDVEVCDVSFSGIPQPGCDDSNEKIVYEAAVRSMFVGWKTKVQGRTTKCSDRFHINLECRNTCDKTRVTIPLHIGVRFQEGSIVRNTRNGINESDWGHEERDGGMPIIKGESFTIDLECKEEAFSISINGCHFSDYKHRLPFHTINYMTVTSDVEVCDVSFSGIPQPGCDDSNEKIVYEAAVRSMFVGWKTKVQGRTTKCSDRFHINLECRNTWDKLRVTIPLHIGVRFREGSIVRNTRNGINESDWGHEERDGGMPIIKGESFTIDLECKEEAFSISINGCHFSNYKHRLPFHTINYMTVTSDVEVCDVSFSGTPQLGCDDSNEKIVYEAAVRSMFVGWKTKVQGRTTKCSDRFHINLECRNTWDKLRVTIPLHIGVRFREGSIVRNTRNGINESDWGHEERDGGMPIIKGESFTIDLECKEEAFLISINGCHFSDYKHRLPFHTINYMTVTSDVEVCDVSFSRIP